MIGSYFSLPINNYGPLEGKDLNYESGNYGSDSVGKMSLTGNYNDNIKVLDYWLYHMNLEGKIQETCSNKENCPTR